MGNVRVKLNLKGINQVLRAHQPAVDREGERMAAEAGPGFEYVSKPHQWTARGYVQTADHAGRRRQAQGHVLQGVVGRGATGR